MKSEEKNVVRSDSALVATWALFYSACAVNGIPKTSAWKLLKAGVFDTVCIGRRRYVRLSNFDELKERLAKQTGGAA